MPGQTGVLALLDELQAAEAAGAAALGRWIATCGRPVLRGGLRVIAARDAAHARVAAERLAALGAVASVEPPAALATLLGILGSTGTSDRAKLSVLLARFPRRHADPFAEALGLVEDDETRALLDAVRDDDRSSLEWLRGQAEAGSGGEPGGIPASAARTAVFLDALRAAADGSARVLGAWSGASRLAGLRGGLRALAARAQAHAAAATARLIELGGRAEVQLDAHVLDAARLRFGAAEVGDEEKLALVLDAPHAEHPIDAIESVACALDDDPETRELLRLVAAGEATTLSWLAAYRGAARAPQPRRIVPLSS